MRVLLTGATGFLGRKVAEAFDQSGIEYVAVGRKRLPGTRTHFIESDILDLYSYDDLLKSANATHLVHLAWYTEHGKYWNSHQNIRWMDSSIRLIEAFCANGGRHVVVAGTSAEYDWRSGYLTEDSSVIAPQTLYGTCKDATRAVVAVICKSHSVSLAWGRIFVPYGPGESENRLIPSLHKIFKGEIPPFGVNADSFRDFIHIEDVASAFLELCHEEVNGCYNISTGVPTRVADLVLNIAGVYGADPNIVLALKTSREGEPKIIVGNSDKLRQLGWQPCYKSLPK
jgi:nucleoside-diphosphate-sugar epimerase